MQGDRYVVDTLADDRTYTIIDRTNDRIYILFFVPVSTTVANIQVILAEASSVSSEAFVEFVMEIFSTSMFLANLGNLKFVVQELLANLCAPGSEVANPVDIALGYGGTLLGRPVSPIHPIIIH